MSKIDYNVYPKSDVESAVGDNISFEITSEWKEISAGDLLYFYHDSSWAKVGSCKDGIIVATPLDSSCALSVLKHTPIFVTAQSDAAERSVATEAK